MIHRRSFLGFIACSPAIVRASSLMHVRPVICREFAIHKMFVYANKQMYLIGERTIEYEFPADAAWLTA